MIAVQCEPQRDWISILRYFLTDFLALVLKGSMNVKVEVLGGARKGQHSIRINKQWRICFEWPKSADGPENVEIIDYH